MVRPTYHQHVGNPLQRNQLPGTRPRQEWAHESLREVIRHFTANAALLLLVASGAGALAGMAFHGVVPVLILFIPAALIGSFFCHQFGKHYAYHTTAAPLDRATADVLRRRFTRSGLTFCGVFALGLLPFALEPMPHPGHLFSFRLTVVPVCAAAAVSLLHCMNRLPVTFRAFCDALASWCAYNRGEADAPGLFRSPAGTAAGRVGLMAVCGFFTGVLLGAGAFQAWEGRTLVAASPFSYSDTSAEPLLEFLGQHLLEAVATAFAPAALTLGIAFLAAAPILADCRGVQLQAARTTWRDRAATLAASSDPIERDSYPAGFVDHDGSPLLVPLRVFDGHAWVLGDTESGKTSMGLAPFVEWLAAQGRHSVVVIDLKGDDLALFGALREGTAAGRRRSRRRIPLRYFTNEIGKATYGFNPLLQSNRSRLSRYQLTHTLCAAMNAVHGVHYGERWFSLAGLTNVAETFRQFRDIQSFRDLAKRLDYMIINAKRDVLHNEVRKAGLEPQLILRQLASIGALNVAASTYSAEVMERAIDFSAERSPFTEPQSYYFYLSTALGPGGAGEIARLVAHTLITAAKTTPPNRRRNRVYLVIDEWPEMLSANLAYVLRQARSLGVSVILANQSMQDVRNPKLDLLPVLMSNCRFRQWFAVSNVDDQELLAKLSGHTVEHLRSYSHQQGPNGATVGESFTELVQPRLNINDIRLASDDRSKSIIQITSGDGYARHGGFPFVVRTPFHISREEFEARRDAPWPDGDVGTFPARDDDDDEPGDREVPPEAASSPVVETETIERPRRPSRRRRQGD
jgi:hypothetical protein